jgi:hypothetical protein
MDQLEPLCRVCHKRHRLDLPCWRGRYAGRVTRGYLRSLEQTPVCWLHYKGCTFIGTEADHERPRSRGGGDEYENLRPACHHCNSSRGNDAPFKPDPPVAVTGVGLSPRWRKQ